MKKLITAGMLSLMVLGGVANCDKVKPCTADSDQRGGRPREDTQACKDRKARMTPTEVS